MKISKFGAQRIARFMTRLVQIAASGGLLICAMLVINACSRDRTNPTRVDTLALPSQTWPMYQYAPTHNAVFSASKFHYRWATTFGAKINGGMALLGTTLYVDSFDRRLYAIDVRNGHVRWSSAASNTLMSTPVIANNIVIVGSGENGFLRPDDWASQVWGRPAGDDVRALAINSGKVLWIFHTPGEDMPSAAIDEGKVVFANGDLHAYSIDLDTGSLVWQSDLPGVDSMASVTVSDGLAFVGTCRNAPHTCETRALNIKDGRTVWEAPYGGNDASPAVDHGIVFVHGDVEIMSPFHPGAQDVIAALDERTGRTLWVRNGPARPIALVASAEHEIAGTAVAGILYQSISNDNKVAAIDEVTGNPVWEMSTVGAVKMSPVVTDNRVYFGDTSGVLYDVDRRSGKIIHTTSFDSPFTVCPLIIAGRTMFAAYGDVVTAIPLESI